VERHNERVLALETQQQRLGIEVPGHRRAQWSAEPVQNGASDQELAHIRRLTLQHLEAEVIDDLLIIPREGVDELPMVLATPQRQSGELQSGRPSLCPLVQPDNLLLVQLQPYDVVEERAGLGDVEAQIDGPNLGELPAGAQTAQG